MQQLRPSSPGYNFTVADLQRVRISGEDAARIIARETGGNPASIADLANPATALLAAMLQSQVKANAAYTPVPYDLPIWNRIQIFNQNNSRNYLLIQNVGMGDLLVVFEGAQNSIEDLSSAGGQTLLTTQQVRAVRVIGGGYYEPQVPPSNPVTIFTLNTATNGIAIEGT